MTKQIAILGYNGVNALDLVGPGDVFATANDAAEGGRPYEVTVVSVTGRSFRAESGLVMLPTKRAAHRRFDTIIIPGGNGLRAAQTNRAVATWIRKRAVKARRVVSVCTGIYGLAATGLLKGRRATTHWRFGADVARRFPDIRFELDAIFVRDGRFYTSAGITSGIDLCLALVEEDLGPGVALAVARELVVYLKRPGGQLQYSEPLQFQTRATDRFADLAAWIPSHLNGDLSVENLAARVHLGRRQFSRVFRQAFGASPTEYVEALRLGEASRRLPLAGQTVDSVAASLGYRSADVFRRAFERQFGVAPSAYRERFTPTNGKGR
jgi:transcriptional regulator GlxA family with amidase domain